MINPRLAAQIKALVGQADAANVPPGLLAWWGRAVLPGGEPGAPGLSQPQFESLYGVLQQAALAPCVLPQLLALKAPAMAMRPDAEVPVALVNLAYCTWRGEFATRLDQAAAQGSCLAEPTPQLRDVIDTRRVFMAAPLLHDQWGQAVPAFRGSTVRFAFDARFMVQAAGQQPPAQFEFDAGDGRGYQVVRLGGTARASYGPATAAACSVRLVVNGQVLTAAFSLPLSTQPAAPVPSETWALKAANGSTGTAYVYFGAGHEKLTHPLIMAEGFPGGYASDYLYDTLNQHGTAAAWRAAGHDLVILGFGNGMARIEANAQVAQACIEQAMQRTPNPLVVGGVSMGGLVTRLALATMESRGQAHQTRTFLTIDAPHAGSHTSLAVQWFAQTFKTASPTAALLAALLDSPANQQFVTRCLVAGQVVESPLRTELLNTLREVGNYPQLPQRLAVASGAGDGCAVLAPGSLMLSWQGSAFAHAELHALAAGGEQAVQASGYSLLADGNTAPTLLGADTQPWEGAPGGQNQYNLIAAAIARSLASGEVAVPAPQVCTVPTVSALDLSCGPFEPVPPPGSGASPFHDYICCETNQMHLQFTPAVSRWLIDRLGDPRQLAR